MIQAFRETNTTELLKKLKKLCNNTTRRMREKSTTYKKKSKFTDENTSKLPERKTFGELRNYERR